MATTSTKKAGKEGATLASVHVDGQQIITAIDVETLREFRSSMKEEFAYFSFGNFMLSGSVWLGIERFATLPEPWKDPLFIGCVAAAVTGAGFALLGWRQLGRRKTKIDRIIKKAEDDALAIAAAAAKARAAEARATRATKKAA